MRRPHVLACIATCAVLTCAGCSGSADDSDPVFRIDGPARVDDGARVEPAGGDDSGEG